MVKACAVGVGDGVTGAEVEPLGGADQEGSDHYEPDLKRFFGGQYPGAGLAP